MWVILLILKIVLYIFAALLLILATLLIVPFSYRGEAEVNGGIAFSYRLGWFWNLFSVRGTRQEEQQNTSVYLANRRLFTVSTGRDNNKNDKEKLEDEEIKEVEAEPKDNLKSMFDINLIKEGLQYLKKVIRQISPKYLQLHGTYGFEDPSATGMTAGFIYTLQGLWPQSKISVQPSFTEEVFDLELKAAGQVYAGKLAWDTARFLLKPDIRKKVFKRRKKVKLKSK